MSDTSNSTVKIMTDGVIETRTAHFKDPYDGTTGLPFFPPEELNEVVPLLDKEGFQQHFHAIGDQSITNILNAIEIAVKQNERKDLRHHIAHIQCPRPEDLDRFAKLKVCANFQPFWACADDDMKTLTQPCLGAERFSKEKKLYSHCMTCRSSWQYPIRTLLEKTTVGFGSDWFVSTLNPLEGIQVAVTHKPIGASDNEAVWKPEECISLDQALSTYTLGSGRF